MKTRTPIITIIFLLLAGSVIVNAQQPVEFAPVGAEWYYEYQEIMRTGYVKITAVLDTIIEGTPCVKLEKNRTGYGYYSGLFSNVFGYEYLTVADNCIKIYRNGTFHKLFDFGAEAGDSWTIPGQEDVCEEDQGTIRVVAKGMETVNGVGLRFLRIVDEMDSYWGFDTSLYGEPDTITVYERIGPVGAYLFPQQKCLSDDGEGGPLRCYFDDVLGEFKTHPYLSGKNCDYINEQYQGVAEQNTSAKMTVFPNPCQDKLTLSLEEAAEYNAVVYGHLGIPVLRCSFKGNSTEMDISKLSPGVYCITINNGVSNSSKSFVKH